MKLIKFIKQEHSESAINDNNNKVNEPKFCINYQTNNKNGGSAQKHRLCNIQDYFSCSTD